MVRLPIILLKIILITTLAVNSAGQGYALRPMAKALSDDVGIATGQNVLSVLISRLSDISPYRRALLQYIDSTKGIIDPQTMVSQLCEGIAKETLGDFGLNPDDYLFIISDSDEPDTEFYTVNGENIIEITWGLLKFLKRHNIFNTDALRFILGHEVGHVLMTEERKKGKGKHTVINEEYRADGYGLKAIDKRGGSPMVALRYTRKICYTVTK